MNKLNTPAFKLTFTLAIMAIAAICLMASSAHADKNISVFSCGDFFIATEARIPLKILPPKTQCTQFQVNVLDDFPTGLQQKPENCLDDLWLCQAFYYISQQPPVKQLERCGYASVNPNQPVKCPWDHSK